VAFAVRDSIFAYAADDGEPELLAVHVETGEIQRPHSLTWSPDGRLIAYVNRNQAWVTSTNVNNASVWVLDASGGEPFRVTDEDHLNVSPQWLPDSRHLLFVSDREGQREVYVLEVGPAGARGEPQKVPGPTDAHSISISGDGRRLAYAKFPASQNIWLIPIPQSGLVSVRDAVPVTTGSQIVESHALSPDGQWIAFDSNLRGQQGIYKQRVQGGDPQPVAQMTSHAFSPAWSSDGTEVAFYSGSESAEIFVVPAGGGSPEQLTSFPGTEVNPVWSPDGLAIAFNSAGRSGKERQNVWTISRESVGGPWSEPVQLTESGTCQGPVWAPDGASLLCYVLREGWARVDRDGEVLWHYDPTTAGRLDYYYIPQFSPDGSRIYFVASDPDGSEGIWWIPASGGDATKIVEFDDPSLTVKGFLTVGPSNLYLTIAEYESDIWVMDLEW
jgi:Tol biopolymer transport system component